MKSFNPFREAIPLIRDGHVYQTGKHTFICSSLDAIAHGKPLYGDEWKTVQAAKRHVRKCLGRYTTLDAWIKSKVGHHHINKMNNYHYHKRIQAHRKAWLEKMADEYDRGEIKL